MAIIPSALLHMLLVRFAIGAVVPGSMGDGTGHVEKRSPNVEVIPGPGMPTLAELGITSADLFKDNFEPIQVPKSTSTRLFKRQAACQSTYQASRGNAIACRNYLIQTGSATDCSTGESTLVLCTAGDAEIVGWNYYRNPGGVTTSCSDAAVAASWVIDNCSTCTSDDCLVEGQQAGTANPQFVAYIERPAGSRV